MELCKIRCFGVYIAIGLAMVSSTKGQNIPFLNSDLITNNTHVGSLANFAELLKDLLPIFGKIFEQSNITNTKKESESKCYVETTSSIHVEPTKTTSGLVESDKTIHTEPTKSTWDLVKSDKTVNTEPTKSTWELVESDKTIHTESTKSTLDLDDVDNTINEKPTKSTLDLDEIDNTTHEKLTKSTLDLDEKDSSIHEEPTKPTLDVDEVDSTEDSITTAATENTQPEYISQTLLNPEVLRTQKTDYKYSYPSKLIMNIIDTATTVEEYIAQKMLYLKPFLEDDDINPDEEKHSTIVEFRVKPHTRRNFYTNPEQLYKKYSHLRQKIITTLKKRGMLSMRAQQRILSLIDDLTNELFKSKCEKKDMARTWIPRWRQIKLNYFTKLRKELSNHNMIILDYYNQYFTELISDMQNISRSYTIKCRDVFKTDDNKIPPYGRDDISINIALTRREPVTFDCLKFKICSLELGNFFIDFYTITKDCIMSSFDSYLEMFQRDANIKGKKIVKMILTNSIGTVETAINTTFNSLLIKFKLDPHKDKMKNHQFITDFIINTISGMLRRMHTFVETQMMSLDVLLRDTVLDDTDSYIKTELYKFRQEALDSICKLFETCQDVQISRRMMGIASNHSRQHLKYVMNNTRIRRYDYDDIIGYLSNNRRSLNNNEKRKDELINALRRIQPLNLRRNRHFED